MGQRQSKDELLYQQVSYGNTEGIKALHRDGAGLEYVDREGKTPLIVACLNPALYNVAETLIELGANVNAFRPGRNGGTPLHHAAKQGLENTVRLLLSRGANALLVNDDCQTPLEVAREKGYSNVVRTIESHICLYSSWLQELYGPGFLEVLAPQLLSRKVWAVVLPCGSRNLRKPFKLELAIYTSIQEAQPRTTISLWRASMEEPAFNKPDPAVIISEASTKTRIKLAPLSESDKQQLQQFRSACKGIPQVMHQTFPFNTATPVVPATALAASVEAPPASVEDLELAMAINASFESAMEEGLSLGRVQAPNEAGDGSKREGSSSCAVCLDALVEGVCVPCGHMAGCMSCLNEIKAKKLGCPICRTSIDQVIKVYAI